MNTSKHILASLAASGNRITRARTQVVVYLQKVSEPQSIQMIARGVAVDEVSVYRTIALLKSLDLVEEMLLPDGSRRFALSHGHHHHIICSTCGYVVHVPCDERITNHLKVDSRFASINEHTVSYYGICTECAT